MPCKDKPAVQCVPVLPRYGFQGIREGVSRCRAAMALVEISAKLGADPGLIASQDAYHPGAGRRYGARLPRVACRQQVTGHAAADQPGARTATQHASPRSEACAPCRC